MWLRSAIVATKRDISYQKQRITLTNDEWIATGAKCELWGEKQLLMTLRHELQRLKGMDRVVTPQRPQKAIYRIGEELKLCKVGRCNCGANLTDVLHVYCPACGRRILWEKV